MRNIKILFYLILAFGVHVNEGYRILCFFPFEAKSHFQMFGALCKGLAQRGHKIDMISPFPSPKPIANYTDIVDLRGLRTSLLDTFSIEFAKRLQQSVSYYMATDFGGALCSILGEEVIQKFLKNPPKDPPYDFVITEYLGSPCYLGIGEVLKVPVAIATSFIEMPQVDDFMGNPQNFAFYPGWFTVDPVVNTFSDRLWNFLSNVMEMRSFYHYTTDQTDMMKKYFNLPHIPDVRELERKVALALVNTHHSYHGIRPLTPALIEVGGMHIDREEPKLSPEIKNWLDSADNGLVYFSLGTLLKIETLPKENVLGLYSSFAKISPTKVLLKCGNVSELPPGLPSNVLTAPWISQVSVLKHKNTRLFVTHGGLMGTQEALYHAVPMIAIPVFADQLKNVNILVHKNIAVQIRPEDINEKSMDAALNAVLHDPKYRESTKKASNLFRDRPLSAMDHAAYWVEYVIRNGPDSLRSPARDLPWWKQSLLDVFAFLIVCLVLVIYFFTIVFRIACRYLLKCSAHKKEKVN